MAKNKDITYLALQSLIKDKDKNVESYLQLCESKMQSMFVYTGAPDTLDMCAIEKQLKEKGHVLFFKDNGKLVATSGTLAGELNEYYQYKSYIVSNPYVSSESQKQWEIGDNCVLMRNDYSMQGMLPIIGSYAVKLCDSEISLNTAAVLSRITMLISAQDDKTKQSAELFLSKIANGDFSVIAENGFFEGVRLQTSPTSNTNYITQLIELVQYYKASFYNEIGLNANYNLKRERLTNGELQVNVDALLPLVDNMLNERRKALEKVNAMFGTEIEVNLGSAWLTIHNEKTAIDNSTGNEQQQDGQQQDEQQQDGQQQDGQQQDGQQQDGQQQDGQQQDEQQQDGQQQDEQQQDEQQQDEQKE